MNTIDKIKRRVRQIVRAAMGKPADQITIGVEIKNCEDCERGICSACCERKETARWENGFCTRCGTEAITEWNETGGEHVYTNYCPYCGALML